MGIYSNVDKQRTLYQPGIRIWHINEGFGIINGLDDRISRIIPKYVVVIPFTEGYPALLSGTK